MSHIHVVRYRPCEKGDVHNAVQGAATAMSKVEGVISSRVFGDHSHIILVTEFDKWAVLDKFEDNADLNAVLPALGRAEDGGNGEFWFGR